MGHVSFLTYADDVIIVGENLHAIQKTTEAVLGASKKAGESRGKLVYTDVTLRERRTAA
jgi:hypothetical protein